jgi:Fic family protein
MPSWYVHYNVRVHTELPEIASLISKCYALASVINNIPITPSRRERIDRLNILRAVRGTTGIEGAQLTEEDVKRIMESPKKAVLPPNRKREEQEARNAEKLMLYVARLLNRRPNCPLTENLIRKLHSITTRGIDYPYNVPGEYRNFPVYAGTYVPPEGGEKVQLLMREFVAWYNEGLPTSWDPIIGAIVAHFYIVSIHPFGDGNGRTSRAVESFLLYRAKTNARGFYSLANYYYQNRSEYVSYLDKVRFETDGDLTPFVLFALKGLSQELEAVHREVLLEVREIAFRDYVREMLHDKLATKFGERLINFMLDLGTESVTLKSIRSGEHKLGRLYRDLTPKTLSRDLNYLIQKQLIISNEGKIRANLDIMGRFTAPSELTR